MPKAGKCCCCGIGSIIVRWQNISMVRPVADSGGVHYTSAPFPRADTVTYEQEQGSPTACETAGAGYCGTWLQVGDANGVSAQEIDATVDDIMACAPEDTTHFTSDHNCYQKNGTVDMRGIIYGGSWYLAKKYWHGMWPLGAPENCTPDPNTLPTQTKYLTLDVTATFTRNATEVRYGECWTSDGTYKIWDKLTDVWTGSVSVQQKIGVSQLSGIQTLLSYQLLESNLHHKQTEDYVDGYNGTSGSGIVNADEDQQATEAGFGDPNYWLVEWAANCDGTFDFFKNPSGGFIFSGTSAEIASQIAATSFFSGDNGYFGRMDTLSLSGNSLILSISIVPSPRSTIVPFRFLSHYDNSTAVGYSDWSGGGSMKLEITLSDPYTAAMFYDDLKSALRAVSLTDFSSIPFRTDEKLAQSPIVLYDEVGTGVAPAIIDPQIDDYSGTMIDDASGNHPGDPGYVTTWPQRDWIDPNNYLWQASSGQYFGQGNYPVGFTGGASLIQPLRNGEIISVNPAGSDRHFWFDYTEYKRVDCSTLGDPSYGSGYIWVADTHGKTSVSPIPSVAKRWMNKMDSQYDGALCARSGVAATALPGNFPQSFFHQQGDSAILAKSIAATQNWKAVNYGKPCGWQRYEIDQTTVLFVQSTLSANSFFCGITGNAIAPLATGGLQVGDYIGVTNGTNLEIRQVSAITDNGTHLLFTVDTGDPIETVPNMSLRDPNLGTVHDDGLEHLGRLRWVNYTQYSTTFVQPSPICGRIGITVDTTALTVTAAAALPYAYKDINGNILVDVYDSSMASKVQLSLTRVSDTVFSYTGSATTSHVWMVGRDVDYTKYDDTPQLTGVHLDWQFNPRWADGGYTSPPTWYAGVSGCVSCTIEQFNYTKPNGCQTIVGIVPFYQQVALGGTTPTGGTSPGPSTPNESLSGAILYPTPDVVTIDQTYGAHWQGAVMLMMQDPFWQEPFMPNGVTDGTGDTISWLEDDGTNMTDEPTATPPKYYYPHRPMVEACAAVPAGKSLPTGLSLFYDGTANEIAPPYYPNGIPIGDPVSGDYGNVETAWGLAGNACASIAAAKPFSGYYSLFVNCP